MLEILDLTSMDHGSVRWLDPSCPSLLIKNLNFVANCYHFHRNWLYHFFIFYFFHMRSIISKIRILNRRFGLVEAGSRSTLATAPLGLRFLCVCLKCLNFHMFW